LVHQVVATANLDALEKQSGPIPVVGLANGTGTAALLAADGVTISRVIEVASLGSGDQEVELCGALNVTQLGSGTLVLAGVNTYTGTTSVAAGTVLINGSGRTASSARIDVGAAGSLVFDRADDLAGRLGRALQHGPVAGVVPAGEETHRRRVSRLHGDPRAERARGDRHRRGLGRAAESPTARGAMDRVTPRLPPGASGVGRWGDTLRILPPWRKARGAFSRECGWLQGGGMRTPSARDSSFQACAAPDSTGGFRRSHRVDPWP
jgi:autotransporter-associated beta strand protein